MALFTSNGFHLYNIENFFFTHPNALLYCSAVTPHSSKISDSVTSDRSFTVTKKVPKVFYTIFSRERTTLVLSDSAQGTLNLYTTSYFFVQVVV